MKRIFLILVMAIIVPVLVFAMGPKIDKSIATWDQNPEADLGCYYLYWRTPQGSYSDINRVRVNPTDRVGTHDPPSYDLMGLSLPVGTYFIVVTAVDTADNESGPSNEAPFDASVPGNPSGVRVTK